MKEIPSGIASLKISGKPFVLDPKNMNYDGIRYTVKESGAEFSLEISELDNAFTSRFCGEKSFLPVRNAAVC